jgi:hypothetical protein
VLSSAPGQHGGSLEQGPWSDSPTLVVVGHDVRPLADDDGGNVDIAIAEVDGPTVACRTIANQTSADTIVVRPGDLVGTYNKLGCSKSIGLSTIVN